MEAEQAEQVPGPSDNEDQGPNQDQPAIPPRKRELHPIGIDKERTIKLEPAHREAITKSGQTEQLNIYKKVEEEDAKKEKEIEKTTRAAMKFHVANFRKQEKQAAIQDKILKDIGANLEPDRSHPSFPVMIMDKGNGDLGSITSINKFNEVRKLAPTMMMGSRMLWKWIEDEEDEEEEDDGNDFEEEEAGLARRDRLLEMMMRDVIRDDEAHPDRLRGNGANDLPNVMQRLENTMERQNRQRDAMRNEIVAARGFRVF